VAGRAYDPCCFSAVPIAKGFDVGLATHCGKILECAAIASSPGSGSDCMFGTIYHDRFVLETLNPIRHCTTLSVSAHKTNPSRLPGPGGICDLSATTFTQLNEDQVEVRNTKYIPTPYTIKLEGAKLVGYRCVSIAGSRDPIFIQQVDHIIQAVTERVKDNFKDLDDYHLNFKVYGKNGVMGDLEPVKTISSHELCVIIDAVGPTQEIANTVCSFARSTMLHYGYPGRIATAGNLAFPYSPSDFKAGAVYNFSLYHLLAVDEPLQWFKPTYEWIWGNYENTIVGTMQCYPVFKTTEIYEKMCDRGLISPAVVCELYKIKPEAIINIINFKPANAIKVTIIRPMSSGDIRETDVYGAQQHAPWLSWEFDWE